MQVSEADILIIPGLGNSGADHWQSRWEAKLKTARRVEQGDWTTPDLAGWTIRLREEAVKATRPLVLIAHSFGGHVVAAAAPELGDKVRGAFLVAPPSQRRLAALGGAEILAALPKKPLPFKTLVVASRDDEHGTYEELQSLAALWGAGLSDAGYSGHINAESGHGPWPEGLMRFASFMKDL